MTGRRGVSWLCRRWFVAATVGAALGALLVAPPARAKDRPVGDENHDGFADDFDNDEGGRDFPAFTLADVAKVIGVSNAKATGAGIDVALIDTGVVPVPGLGPTVIGPDLSFDSQVEGNLQLDGYGHGTHMAGIINGNGLEGGGRGIAPDARVVSIKVGASNGATDVSQVIAAIDWVVQHRDTDGLNIRVLNLSFGTDGVQPYEVDPLAFAVENAWRHGIVVVVAAGNAGADAPSLDNPALDPFVLAVGATEPNGSWATNNDTVAPFSSRGTPARGVDIVAPGRSIVSLRDPGSNIDLAHPEAVEGTGLFRGSGTSQAAAVVSGVVADLLERRPSLTPDQVKGVLMATARPLKHATPIEQGSGLVDLGKAVKAVAPTTPQPWTFGTGAGSLEGARGTIHVVDSEGVALTGEQDIFGTAWDGQSWSVLSWSGQSWSGGEWLGQTWSGQSWSGQSWSGQSWSGQSWSGQSWSGEAWSGQTWSGQSWSGQSWSGQTWTGQSWSSIH